MQIAGLGSLTIEVSFLTCCILFVRKVFTDRIHPVILKCLWGFLALRMLIPVQIPVGKGLFSVKEEPVWVLLWLGGMFALLVVFLGKNIRFHFMLKQKRELYGRKNGLLVYFVNRRVGSCLVGLFCPKIYISKLASDSSDWCNWIGRHELCHYQAKDNWYSFLRNLCLLVQWFNPLIWYAARCCVEDFEVACDYQVLREENNQAQMEYGKCLVAMAAKNPKSYIQNITTGVSLDKGNLKRRIENMGKENYGSPGGNIVLFTVLFLVTLCCFCAPENREHPICEVMEQLPCLNEWVVRYELEKPTRENMSRVLENIQYKSKKYRYEDYQAVQMDQQSIMFFISFSKMAKCGFRRIEDCREEIDAVVQDIPLMIKFGDEERQLVLEEDSLLEQHEGEKYSLWINGQKAGLEKELETVYSIEFGNHVLLPEEECEVRGEYICLLKSDSFDKLYDTKKLMRHNPCRVLVMD
ncbi:MAG: M56 family metallopeptidase [Bacteroidales bacterium]|nr:M56 family metallopeptidase [Clostridium sp.]MCM1203751.1 M56 family metallopeptidase [Bacteroidales bacterium]